MANAIKADTVCKDLGVPTSGIVVKALVDMIDEGENIQQQFIGVGNDRLHEINDLSASVQETSPELKYVAREADADSDYQSTIESQLDVNPNNELSDGLDNNLGPVGR